MKILTNFEGDNDKNWKPYVDYFAPPENNRMIFNTPYFGRYLRAFVHAWNMYRARDAYDLILLSCNTAGVMFSLLQYFLIKNKKPVFYFSNLWDVSKNKLLYYLKYLQFWIIDKSAIGYSLNSSCDAESYSQYYPIDKDKFICIPYFPTLWKYKYTIRDEGFVFSGGNGQRDYKQLIEAARVLPYKFYIACSDNNLFYGIDIPDNVTVESVSPERYRELMASATIHVVAMSGGFLRSGGHQTYLNAMVMGKAVIVTDKKGTLDYIEHGKDGFLVEPGDVASLTQYIRLLMEDAEIRGEMSKNALNTAKNFNGSDYLKKLRTEAKKRYVAYTTL
jgi:glycosyltransferase involved in cell wall biosynthesis